MSKSPVANVRCFCFYQVMRSQAQVPLAQQSALLRIKCFIKNVLTQPRSQQPTLELLALLKVPEELRLRPPTTQPGRSQMQCNTKSSSTASCSAQSLFEFRQGLLAYFTNLNVGCALVAFMGELRNAIDRLLGSASQVLNTSSTRARSFYR